MVRFLDIQTYCFVIKYSRHRIFYFGVYFKKQKGVLFFEIYRYESFSFYDMFVFYRCCAVYLFSG